MKKEGTGNPQNPDIAFDAEVRMEELRFEEVPDPEVRFRGNTMRNSVWRSSRENLPDRVREGAAYRNAGVRLRIASEIAARASAFQNTFDKEGVKKNLG
jgi:hypothetical protein